MILYDISYSLRSRNLNYLNYSAATRLRMKDPGKVMQDQAAFKEQTKYKTFYRFVFNLEWESYEG